MKKKLLSMTIAAAMAVSCASAVTAEDKTPAVYVDSSEIFFDDQAPVILGEGTTLVPARGVFEAMGATVEWDQDKQQVEVTSADNKTLVRLVIGDGTLRVFDISKVFETLLSGQDFNAPEKDVALEVVPQIINDRTMIPLRAISEALDADVKWDGQDYRIDITTEDAPSADAGVPGYSLSASLLTVQAGETFDIYVNASNIPEGTFVSSVTATVKYNKNNFEYVSSSLVGADGDIEGALGASNANFAGDYLKSAYITINGEAAAKTDGPVMKITFKSLNGQKGEFSLSSGYHTRLGYNTTLLLDSLDGTGAAVTYEGNDFKVSSDVLVINGEDVPAATLVPAETVNPEATAQPTDAPDTTAQPTATEAPTETAEPTQTPEATAQPTAEPAK